MMKKKFVLGVLCVSMILAAGIGVSAEVSENHSQWAEESLISADEAGLLPNFFSDRDLTANISRIDFCHLAYKMLEQKSLISENNVKSSFADTDDAEVAFLANSGIINGRSETKFAPNDDITREEAAVILTNTAEFMDVKEDITLFDTVFSDYDTVSDWAKESVRKMDSLGIMRGVGDNNFSPKSNYTMEQSAVTMLKLFNLDVSDYASNVYEVKIDGDLSIFNGKNKQWIKKDGKTIFTYDGPEDNTLDNERSFIFFEKSGKWYYYIHNNKSNVSAGYNKCSDIYSAETGEIVYKLNAVLLQSNKKDTVDFADDYYRVIKHSEYGGEGAFSVEGMKVYSYDGEEIASSSYDSKNGGGSLDTSAYPCNNRQIRIDFEKVDTDSAEYWVPGENLLAKYPYTYKEYGNSQAVREPISYIVADTLKGYTPVKLSVPDWNGNNYAVFNVDGIPVYKSNTEIFTMIYEGDLCIGEIKGDSIQVSDAKKNQYITTLEWDKDKYNTVDKYVHEYLAKNIESECFSPNGSYTVQGYNMLKCSPYSLYTFWKEKEFSGYTPVYTYYGDGEEYRDRYFLYNPDGKIIVESSWKIYLIEYDGRACYTTERVEPNDQYWSGEKVCTDVYDLKTGELVARPNYINVEKYMK